MLRILRGVDGIKYSISVELHCLYKFERYEKRDLAREAVVETRIVTDSMLFIDTRFTSHGDTKHNEDAILHQYIKTSTGEFQNLSLHRLREKAPRQALKISKFHNEKCLSSSIERRRSDIALSSL